MEKLIFDSGVKEYELGAGVLRMNPSDPNLYARFMDAIPKIQNIEDDMVKKGRELDDKSLAFALDLMRDADAQIKAELNAVFAGNDFDAILEGVNLMAVSGNGERVITNLIDAITPVIENGVKYFSSAAVGEARQNREQRRALLNDGGSATMNS